jgi:hypothetical protein
MACHAPPAGFTATIGRARRVRCACRPADWRAAGTPRGRRPRPPAAPMAGARGLQVLGTAGRAAAVSAVPAQGNTQPMLPRRRQTTRLPARRVAQPRSVACSAGQTDADGPRRLAAAPAAEGALGGPPGRAPDRRPPCQWQRPHPSRRGRGQAPADPPPRGQLRGPGCS